MHESWFNVECGSLKVAIVNLAQGTIVVTVETRRVYVGSTKPHQQLWWINTLPSTTSLRCGQVQPRIVQVECSRSSSSKPLLHPHIRDPVAERTATNSTGCHFNGIFSHCITHLKKQWFLDKFKQFVCKLYLHSLLFLCMVVHVRASPTSLCTIASMQSKCWLLLLHIGRARYCSIFRLFFVRSEPGLRMFFFMALPFLSTRLSGLFPSYIQHLQKVGSVVFAWFFMWNVKREHYCIEEFGCLSRGMYWPRRQKKQMSVSRCQ